MHAAWDLHGIVHGICPGSCTCMVSCMCPHALSSVSPVSVTRLVCDSS